MKKKITVAAAVIACISIIACGSAAYFTNQTTAENVITAGDVDIALYENGKAQSPDNAVLSPGGAEAREVTVKNIGRHPCYVRIKTSIKFENVQPEVVKADEPLVRAAAYKSDNELVTLDINNKNWTAGEEDFFYYNSILQPGETTEPLFTEIRFSVDMGNRFDEAGVSVEVTAYAVQSENNAFASVLDVDNWPEA